MELFWYCMQCIDTGSTHQLQRKEMARMPHDSWVINVVHIPCLKHGTHRPNRSGRRSPVPFVTPHLWLALLGLTNNPWPKLDIWTPFKSTQPMGFIYTNTWKGQHWDKRQKSKPKSQAERQHDQPAVPWPASSLMTSQQSHDQPAVS